MIYLQGLKLNNFRCYTQGDFEFSSGINILVGENAVGKTSIAEAIHCLGFLKSHKASGDNEMIRKGADFSVIKADIVKSGKVNEVLLSLTSQGKKIQVNHKVFRQLSEYLGYLHVVFFCPEDLDIVKGSPSIRRKFLDSNLCSINEAYIKDLILYRKILKQRNEVLKNYNKYDRRLLDILTKSMIPPATTIIDERKKFIDAINPLIEEKSRFISGGQERVTLIYQPNLTGSIEGLIANTKNDLLAKTTTLGPHRDDFCFEINGAKASQYASQGQQRTAALALKLAFADYLKEKTEDIVIILDDVFSELDSKRQNEILKLMNSEYQIFITTTTINNLASEILEGSKIMTIRREDLYDREETR
ncbi:MAG: DNA replication/repair protein RecF [Bacilli bacterium]|nr:DNA replication/repair protein RecF [Bacilli bacterium]